MIEGSVTIMYCSNCGNKVDEKAYICVNCGVILKKDNGVPKKVKKDSNVTGVFSIIFGVIALLISIGLFFIDISNVGMYTEIYEKVAYAIGFVIIPFIFMILSLIFALIKKNKTSNKVGLVMSLISAFLIITEVMVVIIY